MEAKALLLTTPSPPPPPPPPTPPKPKHLHHPLLPSKPLKSIQTPPKPRKFPFNDAFPDSLPLHNRNPHSIHKDIQTFSRRNKLKEALTILDYLDKLGIPVNVTTFSSLLTACARSKSLAEGRQVHVHIRINGLEKNEFLMTKLVHMYSSCGSQDDARRVFDEIPNPGTVYPWNALLRGNVVMGGRRKNSETYSIFAEMRRLGVELNVYTFSCLIKSLAGSPAFKQGMKTHCLLIKNGFFGSSVLLGTSLIDMYFKCRKVRMACKVFDEIGERDVVVWGAMIAGFAHNWLKREALVYFLLMRRDGFLPNSVILTTVLPVIGDLSERNLGREVHCYVIKHYRDQSRQVFVQSALIDMYCKCGDIVSGRRVFYGSKVRNAVSWTALISGYALNGRLGHALRSVAWMQQEGVKLDVVCVATVLPVCAEMRALRQGKEVHCYAIKNGFLPNVSVSTSLMMMYSNCRETRLSCRIFDGMEKRNIIAWTAMIESYLKNGRFSDALNVFRSMQISKHRPDSVTMARALSSCGEVRAVKLGKEIHAQILKRVFENIPFVSSAVVSMYGRCREIKKARLVFDAVASKGSMTWTAIIEAYGLNGWYRDAGNLFQQMEMEGYVPKRNTFESVLRFCERGGFADEALAVFDSMTRKHNLEASEENYDCIIGLLTRLNRVNEAQRFVRLRSVLDQSKAHGVVQVGV
ncbi:Pentatricopeptide repeat-containing protein [Acorus gramineus]|uniref:Pentatricopeptide repeat-containing protein n=1 Tax=Acorus gramineus TaxID=55184 RepID=A0AAV9AIU7_ACOGR|nr:Pentatricopeptide repeat-containing protein [Acorus gramineus]